MRKLHAAVSQARAEASEARGWLDQLDVQVDDTTKPTSGFGISIVARGRWLEFARVFEPVDVDREGFFSELLQKGDAIWRELLSGPSEAELESASRAEAERRGEEELERFAARQRVEAALTQSELENGPRVSLFVPPNLDGTGDAIVRIQVNMLGKEISWNVVCGQINELPPVIAGRVQQIMANDTVDASAPPAGLAPRIGVMGDVATRMAPLLPAYQVLG